MVIIFGRPEFGGYRRHAELVLVQKSRVQSPKVQSPESRVQCPMPTRLDKHTAIRSVVNDYARFSVALTARNLRIILMSIIPE